jgi:hypothetical protein
MSVKQNKSFDILAIVLMMVLEMVSEI